MDLSGADRSAVRLGYDFTILQSLMPGYPAPVQTQAGASRASTALTANNFGEGFPVSCSELYEFVPVADASPKQYVAPFEIAAS